MSYNGSLNPNNNYPIMTQSQWDSAPFNQADLPEETFDTTVSYCLSRDAPVTTDDYEDEDGKLVMCSPNEAYETRYKSMENIIDFAREAALYFLEHKDYKVRPKFTLQKMVDSCIGWTVDEFNVEQV